MTTPLIAIAGTGTEVGKTWFGVRLLEAARANGLQVAVRKPAQSFALGEEGDTDADQLARAAQLEPFDVCPEHRWYPVPMAPVMAADVLGRPPFTTADLAAETSRAWPAGTDLAIVETAGGLRSPLADDGDSLDLINALEPDLVVLVADAGLGTLNDCRSAHAMLGGHHLLVVVNRFDQTSELHRRNLAWLAEREHLQAAVADDAVARILGPLLPAGKIEAGDGEPEQD